MSVIYGIVEDFKKAANDKIASLERTLGKGKVNSYEEYKSITGEIAGIRKAIALHDETVRNYMREENSE